MFWVTTATTENFFLEARFETGTVVTVVTAVTGVTGVTGVTVVTVAPTASTATSGSFALRPRPRPDILLTLILTILFRLVRDKF